MQLEIELPVPPALRMTGALAHVFEEFAGVPIPPSPPRPGSILPERFEMPAMSPELRAAIDAISPPRPPAVRGHLKTAARDLLETLSPFAAPVSGAIFACWVRPVLDPLRNVLGRRTDENIAVWIDCAMIAVGHLESGAFTLATQREARERLEFFPFASDIYGVVAPAAVTIRHRIATLQRIVAAQTEISGRAE